MAGLNLHDLMPLPYTAEALRHVAGRIAQVQDFLEQRIVIENVSSYVTYRSSEMTEWEFIAALTAEADCDLLLDVNNIYVSSINHGFNAREFLDAIPVSRVRQIHLAGHSRQGEFLIDTHDTTVPEPVWELYRHTAPATGSGAHHDRARRKYSSARGTGVGTAARPGNRRRFDGTGRVMKLAQLQQTFQAHMLRGDRSIENEIAADDRFPVALRLGVYTDAYAARLVEVLGESFPAVQAALGAKAFAGQVGEFVRQHPSRFRSAREYGADLSQWLASRLTGPRAQGSADLARFEWAVAAAFDAADRTSLQPESLAGIAPAQWPQLRFEFSPTLRRVSVSSNCVAWWKFACAGQTRPHRWRSTCTQQWLVWRQELAVFYRRLSKAETQSLDAALAGQTFGEWCQPLADPTVAATLLQRWFNAGLVVGASVVS